MTIDPMMAGLVSALSCFGGVASYLQGRREGRVKTGVLDAAAELTTSAVAGWACFFLGLWQAWPEPLVCLTVIVSTQSGAAILKVLVNGALGMINKLFSQQPPQPPQPPERP